MPADPPSAASMRLADRIHQARFSSSVQEAMLNVIATSSWLQNEMASQMAEAGLTPAQYNVLRILRGSHPTPLACSDIGTRLLDRTPDVTRLLDRLQRAGLVTRQRAAHDRRVVEVSLTDEAFERLRAVDPVVEAMVERLADRISEPDARVLSDALDRMRGDDDA